MAILIQCSICNKKQSNKNKLCTCGENLDKAKKSKRVKFWICYRLPGGKQRWEMAGSSLEDAKAAEGKRRGQKKENRIFEMLPESKITFNELTKWYLKSSSVTKLRSTIRIEQALARFNDVFGEKKVASIQLSELEEYQDNREKLGRSASTIDVEMSYAKTMINKAFDHDLIGGHTLKVFKRTGKRLKAGSNARKRIIQLEEYLQLLKFARPYLKTALEIIFYTGMRIGELRLLKWSYIDKDKRFIRIPAEITKEKKSKIIPINNHVREILKSLPRALHNEYVILRRGDMIKHKDGFSEALQMACKKAGIPYGRKADNGITIHDMRRTVKTNMMNAGIIKEIRDTILGHSLTGMDVHYIVPDEAALMEAIEKYTVWIDGKLEDVRKNVYQNVIQTGV